MVEDVSEMRFVVILDWDLDPEAVRPNQIVVREDGSVGRFGKYEVEEVAGKLVQFFQSRGTWVPFTITELLEFYRGKGWNPDMMFFGLLGPWYDDSMSKRLEGWPWTESDVYLTVDHVGKYYVTNLFLHRCMQT